MAALPFEGPPALTVGCQAPAYLEEEALLAHLGVPLLGHCNTRGSLVQANLSSLRLRATGVANATHKWEDGTPGDLYSGGCHPGPGESLPEITGRGAGRSGHCCPHLEARSRTVQELRTGHAVYVRQGRSVPR